MSLPRLLCSVASSTRIRRFSVACGGRAEASSGEAQLEAKAGAFLALAARLSFTQAVLFCARQHEAAWLAQRLCDAGFPAAYLSGASPIFNTHILYCMLLHTQRSCLHRRPGWHGVRATRVSACYLSRAVCAHSIREVKHRVQPDLSKLLSQAVWLA